MTQGLDLDTIQKLLKDDTARSVVRSKVQSSTHARPIQVGPLRYRDESMRCAARGCAGPTLIQVDGIPYCYTHALYALNHIIIQCHSDYEHVNNLQDCICNAGRHSMGNVHTDDCPIYEQEMKARNGSASSSSV